MFALINEGARILDERIAARSADVDAIWCNGYGYPRHRGGPMFYADTLGLAPCSRASTTTRRRSAAGTGSPRTSSSASRAPAARSARGSPTRRPSVTARPAHEA